MGVTAVQGVWHLGAVGGVTPAQPGGSGHRQPQTRDQQLNQLNWQLQGSRVFKVCSASPHSLPLESYDTLALLDKPMVATLVPWWPPWSHGDHLGPMVTTLVHGGHPGSMVATLVYGGRLGPMVATLVP